MTILITGSRGKTALPLTELLLEAQYPVLVASRSPSSNSPGSHLTVRFNWHDPSTWEGVFEHAQAKTSPIDRVYLVGPDEIDTGADHVIAFMKFARRKGVRRMVLLSAWEITPGGVLMGRAHETLRGMGEEDGVEWTVLRPQFFFENFAETVSRASIKHENRLYSGAGDGRVAFISAQDIAAVAYRALTDDRAHNTEHVITGPQALTYDEVAATLSNTLDREIKHIQLDPNEFRKLLERNLEPQFAKYMVDLDVRISEGAGSKITDTVEQVTERKPKTFAEFAMEKKAVWS